ncbi:GAF domain-containing protein [Cellulophaga sp. RHA_52]|uniref:GAF domain-containing sensor histidine kinase n=1 Tax=Cellulophaga TaxID=104264 RepID=UPI0004F84CC2|nr:MULTISPECIES: GAF domain-containing sensor histidine kinase [Cellulophaga]AIM60615.1 histidine kinase [Cellulophaga lytica]TVZ07841.1 GAF domain-containing protein [Cellulophaga sp. RHA_52]
MIAPKEHIKERERLDSLQSYSILDSLPESDYDNITAIAAEICNMPMAMITLIDKDRQWFKSSYGIDVNEMDRQISFCGHAIHENGQVFMVPNTSEDERFHDNPLVTGDTHVMFYAGVPFTTEEGLPLGTLCVVDQKPNTLTEHQQKSLQALSKQVMNLLSLRKSKKRLEEELQKQEEKNLDLERFAFIAAHDLKSPLNNVSSLTSMFLDMYQSKIDDEGKQILKMIIDSSDKLKGLIEGLLDYSRSESILGKNKVDVKVETVKNTIFGLFSFEQNIDFTLKNTITDLYINETALDQILINLVTNAIKYSDKKQIKIELGVSDSETHYQFYVKDNGPGIPQEKQEQIFKIFEVNANQDKYGIRGNGIGLATVKKIVEKSGGNIQVSSTLGQGATFSFSIKK